MNAVALLDRSDALTQVVAAVLLLMSVATWVIMVWKTWLLHRASGDLRRSVAAFWQSQSMELAPGRVRVFDRTNLVLPMVIATNMEARNTVAAGASRYDSLTRALRGALGQGLARLQFGQTLLATVGSIAPFVGLLGTVWGIYHALAGMAGAAQVTLDRISGPVGEALIMTAAGLVVAIPAVLAYNVHARLIAQIEAEMEGFAHDLRALLSQPPQPGEIAG